MELRLPYLAGGSLTAARLLSGCATTGTQTLSTVRAYQGAKSLSKGGLNYETIAALGIKLGR